MSTCREAVSRSMKDRVRDGVMSSRLLKPATARKTKDLTIRDTFEMCAGKIIGCLRFTLKY